MPRTRFGHVLAMGVFGALALSTGSAQQAVRPLTPRVHTAWTAQDGAPSGAWNLAQTADGYLWLATATGLFRFDGVRFELFQPTRGRALPSPNTTALLALRDGGLL